MIHERKVEMAMLYRSVRHTVGRISRSDDIWPIDPPHYGTGESGSYDNFFDNLLCMENAQTFEELMRARKADKKPTNVLDLFGSGYHINDMSVPDSVTGIRLKNTVAKTVTVLQDNIRSAETELQYAVGSEARAAERQKEYDTAAINRIKTITTQPHWSLVEGNLFLTDAWKALDKNSAQRGIDSFDLITIKPEGAIDDWEVFALEDGRPEHGDYEMRDRIYSMKFLRLLNRAYQRLNSDDGQLYTEVPAFIADRYLDELKDMLCIDGKIQTDIVPSSFQPYRKNMRLIRYPESIQNLEEINQLK